MSIPFSQLYAFIRVVEEKSFVAAANKLQISAAAVTRKIQRLEADLGTELLKRSTRQLILTEAGQIYYTHIKKTLNELEEAQYAIQQNESANGILSISCSSYYASHILLPILQEFVKFNPEIKIKLILNDRKVILEKEPIDLILGARGERIENLVRRKIGETYFVLVAAPDYLKKKAIPKKPTDLLHHDYLEHSLRSLPDKIIFKNRQSLILKPVLYADEANTLKHYALAGWGIGKFHHYLVKNEIANGSLIEILPRFFDKTRQPLYLFYKKTRYLAPKIRNFIEFFLKKI